MAYNITNSGARILITQPNGQTVRLKGDYFYGFNDAGQLEIIGSGKTFKIPFADLQINSSPPATIAAALTALDAVFLSAGATASTSVSASVSGSNVTTTADTAQDITGLSVAVGSNKKYKVVAVLAIGSSASGGSRYAINGPSGSAILTGIASGSGSSVSSANITRVVTIGTLTASTAFLRVNNTGGSIQITAFVTTGNTAGNIQMQFASATAGETSTVYIGSTLEVTEIT